MDRAPASSGIRYLGLTVSDAALSADWYIRVLGFRLVKEIVLQDGWLSQVQVNHHDSDTTIGLIHHRGPAPERFDEHRAGLDHVEINVPTREDLLAWAARLDAEGVPHSGVTDARSAQMVTFRDPDNIQLELYWRKNG